MEAKETNLTKHLAQQEALRQAQGSPLRLDAMMAKISADVTAEAAQRKKDHAAAARKHRNDLALLPVGTPDREKAMDGPVHQRDHK